MPINMYAVVVAALIPMIFGFIWYNPNSPMGKLWIKETGMTEEKAKGANMPLIFGLSLLFSFLLAFIPVSSSAVHQMGLFSLLQNHKEEATTLLQTYANEFRSFEHGAIHGTFLGLFFALPIMATNAMFERKSWKYIFVNVAYWTICLAVMGGIICAWKP